jgi:RNA polymerase sigma-70 factor (ECF subfamily)
MPNKIKYLSDEELYSLLCKDKKQARLAFDEIYSRYATKLYIYCTKILYDPVLAEDIFQETFMRLYETTNNQRQMTNLGAFLFRIARNLCLNEKARKHHSFVSIDDVIIPFVENSYFEKEKSNVINLALNALPKKFREVVILKEFLGLTYSEIADILNSTVPAVRIRIYRAKEKLRELLTPYIKDFEKND